MRHLFVATLMVVGALLIVQAAATMLQAYQIDHRPQWNDPTFDEALAPRPPAPKKPPGTLSTPSQATAAVAQEAAHEPGTR